MKLLLDTNAYSAMLRGDQAIAKRVQEAEQVVMSVIVMGELLLGFRIGTRYEANLARLKRFLESPYVSVAQTTEVTADRFARIGAQLRAVGRPIPTNDVWIAAHAMEHGAELLSYDRHFEQVAGVAWIDPAAT